MASLTTTNTNVPGHSSILDWCTEPYCILQIACMLGNTCSSRVQVHTKVYCWSKLIRCKYLLYYFDDKTKRLYYSQKPIHRFKPMTRYATREQYGRWIYNICLPNTCLPSLWIKMVYEMFLIYRNQCYQTGGSTYLIISLTSSALSASYESHPGQSDLLNHWWSVVINVCVPPLMGLCNQLPYPIILENCLYRAVTFTVIFVSLLVLESLQKILS